MPQQPEVVINGADGKEHVFPPGFDPKRAAEIVRQQSAAPTEKPASGLLRAASSALPVAGGIAGGIVGGPALAAVGGAVGYGYGQLLQHATELPGAIKDVATNMLQHPVETSKGMSEGVNQGGMNVGTEAVMQAAGQKAGDALAAGGGVLSKWLMNRATSRVSAKLMQDFPELNDTLIDNALTVSKGGYGKAYAMLMGAKSKATAALKTADATGATIPVQMTEDLAQSFKTGLLEKLVKSGKLSAPKAGEPLTVASERLDPVHRALFTKIEESAAAGKPMDLTPSQADILKSQLQKESRALYAQRGAPNGPKAMGMDATERAEYATQLNSAIDGIATGYKAANAEARPLIGAVRGIKQAIRPNGNLYQAMVRPAVGAAMGGAAGQREGGTLGGAAGAIAGAALTSPAGMSREAIILAHPVMQGVLRALPKPLAQGLLELLSTQLAESPQPAAGKQQ